MAIRFDENDKIIYLNTSNTTYAMALTNGEKVLRHSILIELYLH